MFLIISEIYLFLFRTHVFYVSGGNLLTFSHLKHLDPEMPSVNQGYYPQQRTYELGLNVTF